MSRGAALTALLVGVVAAPAARADDEATYRLAAAKAGRTLALIAADEGPQRAEGVAGDTLPRLIKAPLRRVAQSPRARDLRGLEPAMKADLLSALLAESPRVQAALRLYARDVSKRIARELKQIDARCVALERAAARFHDAARRDAIPTRKAAREWREGTTLLLYAEQAALLEALLDDARAPAALYRTLGGLFDRHTDRLADGALRMWVKLRDEAPGPLGVVTGTTAITGAHATALARLEASAKRLRTVLRLAVASTRRIREAELKRIAQGARGKEYEEIVPVVKAFRRQFKAVPALKATAVGGVYAHADTARLHFWLAGEGRWIRAHRRVDPLEPVVARFLAARDPELRRMATRPRALASVYGLFEAYAQQPFSAGYRSFAEQVREIANKIAGLEQRAKKRGLSSTAFASAMATRVGVPLSLFRGGADTAERLLSEQLLRATVERGLEAGWLLTQDVERVYRRVRDLRLTGFGLEVDRVEGARDLWWVPAPSASTWLLPPPERLEAGQGSCWVWFLTRPGDPAPTPRVSVFGWSNGQDLSGVAALEPEVQARVHIAGGKPTLVQRVVPGRGVRVWLLPRDRPPLRLVAKGPDGEERDLAPAPGGGWLTPTAAVAAGDWTVRAVAANGATRATLTVTTTAVRGVVLGDATKPTWWVKPNATVTGRVLEGGNQTRGQQRFWVRDAWGRVVHQASAARLSWAVKLPPGRYEVGALGAVSAPLAVAKAPPRLVATRSVAGRPVAIVHPGESFFLRLDAWPAVLAEETRAVTWRILGPAGQRGRRTTRPLPGLAGSAHLLPVRLRTSSRPGKRVVEARVLTARGTLVVRGAFRVEPGGVRGAITFRGAEGPTQRIELGKRGGLLRVQTDLEQVSWTLVGPTGLVRPLTPRFDAQVPLELDEREPPGPYWVFLSGVTRAGGRVFGELRLTGDRPARLELAVPRERTIGRTIEVAVPTPRGFEAPYHVRVGKGEWVKGTSIRLTVKANNVLEVTLRDQRGRRAGGSLRFKGRLGQVAVGGPRYGIAANVTTRRIFAADYALLQSYRKKDLPKDWVELEPGPLTVDGVRDRIFGTVPYDGPGKGRQVAYRSERFWDSLQESARERLVDLGTPVNTPFEVLNTPAPRGEQTLFDLVARHLAKQGGWSFRLESVRVRADGSTPRRGGSVIGLIRNGINKRGGDVRRIEVPGPLAEMVLAISLPKQLDLAKSHRIAFALGAKRGQLLSGRYPDDWEKLAQHALVGPELTVRVRLGATTLKATGFAAAKSVAGVEVGLGFDHLKTVKTRFAGAPRGAERQRLTLAPLGAKGSNTERRFEPLQPGRLANEPETMTITVVARQRRAVPIKHWPRGRSGPKRSIGGVEHRLETDDVPESSIELKIVYVRRAPGARTPPPPAAKPLPALRAGGTPAAIAFRAQRGAAAAALAQDALDAAEQAARAALLARPQDARPWALLAEVAQKRQQPRVALARARWSRDLRPTPRAWLVTAEALLGEGDLDGAAKALKAGLALKPTGRLAGRYAELKKVLD